ncbi:MAG: low molecular weight protein-tyrosine-phosphatase [Chlamydiales bacterium]
MKMIKVLFVCLANICRSPAAEEMVRRLIKDRGSPLEVKAESCGIGDWHLGSLPEENMRKAAHDRGLILTSRARQFKAEFLNEYDYVLTTDHEVLHYLHKYANTPELKSKIHLLTSFSTSYYNQEIPDPYLKGREDYDTALDIIEDSCRGLVKHLEEIEGVV